MTERVTSMTLRNPIHPDLLVQQCEKLEDEIQRDLDWDRIDKSIVGHVLEDEEFMITRRKLHMECPLSLGGESSAEMASGIHQTGMVHLS